MKILEAELTVLSVLALCISICSHAVIYIAKLAKSSLIN